MPRKKKVLDEFDNPDELEDEFEQPEAEEIGEKIEPEVEEWPVPVTPKTYLLWVQAAWARPHGGFMLMRDDDQQYWLAEKWEGSRERLEMDRSALISPPYLDWIADPDFLRAIQEAAWVCGILSQADAQDNEKRTAFFRRVLNVLTQNLKLK